MDEATKAALGVSLETFGPLDVVFNDETGELVSGHQRIAVLKAAGAREVVREGDVGYVEHPKTGERFPVRFVRWCAPMADDAPPKPAEAASPPLTGRARSMQNLVPPCQPGQTRNPTGKNGRSKNAILVAYMDAKDPDDKEGRTRIMKLVQSYYLRARSGNGVIAKWLGDQYFGSAPHSHTALKLEFAEHLRQVASDQWHVLAQALGEQLRTMPAEKIAEVVGTIMAKADTRPERFLEAAQGIMSQQDIGAPIQSIAMDVQATEEQQESTPSNASTQEDDPE